MGKERENKRPNIVVRSEYTEIIVGSAEDVDRLCTTHDYPTETPLVHERPSGDAYPITLRDIVCSPETPGSPFALSSTIGLDFHPDYQLDPGWSGELLAHFRRDILAHFHTIGADEITPYKNTDSNDLIIGLSVHRSVLVRVRVDDELRIRVKLRTLTNRERADMEKFKFSNTTEDNLMEREEDLLMFLELWAQLNDTITRAYGHKGALKQRTLTLLPIPQIATIPEREKLSHTGRITFDDIAGYDDVKERLLDLALVYKYPELAQHIELGNSGAILLHGPPGTGKTTLVSAFASEIGAEIESVPVSSIIDKYVGESARKLDALFREVKERARTSGSPIVLFMDEFDSLGSGKQAHAERFDVVNRLKEHITDIVRNHPNIIITGATNSIDTIDPALLRSGRFELIEVPRPGEHARRAILGLLIGRVASRAYFGATNQSTAHLPVLNVCHDPGIDIPELALKSEGLTGADLEAIIDSIKRERLRNWDKIMRKNALTGESQPSQFAPITHAELLAHILRLRKQLEG